MAFSVCVGQELKLASEISGVVSHGHSDHWSVLPCRSRAESGGAGSSGTSSEGVFLLWNDRNTASQ